MALISFTAIMEKFGKQGEKTGWTYVDIPLDIAEKLNPSNQKSFRVKGFLDKLEISGIALLPMGEGNFIMPLKTELRRQLKKSHGDELHLQIELDKEEYQLNTDFVECLAEDAVAAKNFYALLRSHQNYYSKYIDAAKTESTKAKRISQVLHAMANKMDYGEMLRYARERK